MSIIRTAMNPIRWLTNNTADTSDSQDPDLKPLELPVSMARALERIETTIGQLPRWNIEEVNREAGKIHATRHSRLFGFVDDVYLRLEERADKTIVHARSQSRVGRGDLGQNRRNILQLFAAVA